ncbi:MAG: sulfotransferase family protein [Actinomycetota bacterium]
MEGPPFFIVGSARSGTTLLRLMLNAHAAVAVPPESRFVVELYEGRDEVEVDDLLARLGRHRLFQNWSLDLDAVREQLPERGRAPFVECIEAAYRAYAKARGKSRWGDKTPRYVEHIPLIARLWPDARFVHMIRDGRDVALSYGDLPFGPKTVARAARLWSDRVAAGRRAGNDLGTTRYTEVRYEELTTDIDAGARALCEFLDLEFDPGMLDYTERARSDVLPRAARYNPHVTEEPIAQVRSWEGQMPAPHVRVFEWIAGNVLSEAGYPRRYPRAGIATKLLAVLGLAGLPVGRLPRSTNG